MFDTITIYYSNDMHYDEFPWSWRTGGEGDAYDSATADSGCVDAVHHDDITAEELIKGEPKARRYKVYLNGDCNPVICEP